MLRLAGRVADRLVVGHIYDLPIGSFFGVQTKAQSRKGARKKGICPVFVLVSFNWRWQLQQVLCCSPFIKSSSSFSPQGRQHGTSKSLSERPHHRPKRTYVLLSVLICGETMDRKADLWMMLAPQKSQGTQGRKHRLPRSTSRRGRACLRRCAHLRFVQ